MRGADERAGSLFSYVELESRTDAERGVEPLLDQIDGAIGQPTILLKAVPKALWPALQCSFSLAHGHGDCGL